MASKNALTHLQNVEYWKARAESSEMWLKYERARIICLLQEKMELRADFTAQEANLTQDITDLLARAQAAEAEVERLGAR